MLLHQTLKARFDADYFENRRIMKLSSELTVAADLPRRMSILQLLILTCSTGGLQMVWSTIMSNGTPFLITLGLPEHLTALIWVAAPLSGVIIQPYIGMLSDACQSPWGRRRPFILVGAIGTVICMLGLASTRTVVNAGLSMVQADVHGRAAVILRIMFAVVWLYALNVFIQPLQGGIRALIVDIAPREQQASASAVASLMTGLGNIAGFFFGFVNVKDHLGLEDITQFTFLCLVASIAVLVTVTITCLFVKEQNPSTLAVQVMGGTSILAKLRHIVWSWKTMPKAIRQVCMVQFFAWMGWFPFLFYVSSFVGDLYAAPRLSEDAHMSAGKQAAIIEDAVRTGSLATLLFAIVAFAVNLILPSVMGQAGQSTTGTPTNRSRIAIAWSISHLVFATLMFLTVFIFTRASATVLVACVGVSWAFTLWLPFTIIGEEIALKRAETANFMEGELQPAQQDQTGTIMGLHNCAISAPQIVAALVSSGVFWVAKRTGSGDGIGWVLRIGGIASIVAGVFARRLDR